jgi:1-acyl-sn-glycerol-3-phosphate acyltransferase
MKIVRAVLFFPLALLRLVLVFIVSAATAALGLIWLKLFGFSRTLQQRIMVFWGKSMLLICGILVKKNEAPAVSRFILMTNHRSYLDIFILAAYIPASFVSKAEVKKWPLLSAGARLTNMIFVSRSDLKSLVSAMNSIKASVNSGIPVTLFPEGTTYKGPCTKPFKKGSFKIAADTGIPVIPAAIHYSDEDDAWIDDDTFAGHFLRQMGKPVTHVHLQFGEAVSNSDDKWLRNKVREQIDSLLKNMLILQEMGRGRPMHT